MLYNPNYYTFKDIIVGCTKLFVDVIRPTHQRFSQFDLINMLFGTPGVVEASD